MILCAAACLALNITANRMTAFTSRKIIKKIRHDLYEKIQNLSARQMDRLTVHSAESRLTSDTYNINVLLTRIQRMGIRAPIMLAGGIIMLVGMDGRLALILVALLPLIGITVFFVRKKSKPLYTQQQEKLDDVVRVVQENVTGIRVIKALSKSDYEKDRFAGVNKELSDIGQRAGMITSVSGPISSVIMNLGLTLVVVVGAFRVNAGAIEGSVIIAALQYFVMILQAMMSITRIFIMWNRGQASAHRVAEVLDLPEDIAVEPATEKEENAPHIVFRDVNFSYTGVEKNIESLSFSLERGQTLGILGGTGSGKSTILNLLLRMYDPDEGQILIDGQDIKTIPAEALREKFGVVFQNDFVTGGTIAGNIRFFRDMTDEAVEAAAACAQGSFIAEKEGGMDAEVLMRGNNLSGGQKQRLLIARALAADPEILVLDDASSALDYQTDANLRRALREHYRNTTTVLVTQRVSSLRHADLILVLSDGCVIGAGNHAHLMESCEEYRMIARTQMREEREVL
jgi:ATP-binding cassette subfamily B protein